MASLSDDEEDESLKKAIALSLQDQFRTSNAQSRQALTASLRRRREVGHEDEEGDHPKKDDTDEDEGDLERAIALSLVGISNSPREVGGVMLGKEKEKEKQDVIDLLSEEESEDEDDDDLDAPVILRKKAGVGEKNVTGEKNVVGKVSNSRSDPEKKLKDGLSNAKVEVELGKEEQEVVGKGMVNATAGGGFLGLDRRRMEEERLSRLSVLAGKTGSSDGLLSSQKRKAIDMESSEHDKDGRGKMVKISHPSTFSTFGGTTSSNPKNIISSTPPKNSFIQPSLTGIQYTQGIIKKTYIQGLLRQKDDIKIEEVLQKDDLEMAILSAFQIETEWIQGKLREGTRVVWVLGAKTEWEVSFCFLCLSWEGGR